MSTESPDDDSRPVPGRPRDPGIDDSILDATVQLLAEVGYHQLSIEAVAQRAGVSRPTVYRRYQNKVELVIDVIAIMAARDNDRFEDLRPRTPETGALQTDIEELLITLAASFDGLVERGIVPGFLADLISHPELARRFFIEHLDIAQQAVRAVFVAAHARGEITLEPVPEVVISTFIGAYIYHRFVIGLPFGPEDRRTVATLIARGLAP